MYLLNSFILHNYVNDANMLIAVVYCIIAWSISVILLFASYFINSYLLTNNSEKLSGYECGFDPFNDARDTFYIKFYLISILFIIFDIEIIYFFPWSLSVSVSLIVGFYTMTFFIVFLIVGFWYEWCRNVFDFD